MQNRYETPRLLLRALTVENAEEVLDFYREGKEIFEQYELDRVTNFYTKKYQELLLRYESTMLERGQSLRLWVFLKEEPEKIIGTFSFHNVRYSGYHDCELGYKFLPEFWGMGYAKESVQQGIQVIFQDWGIHRIEALVSPENYASQKLLKNLEFQLEGIRRHAVKLRGEWHNHEVYSRLNG